jgi:hypothetical protein
MPQYNLSDPRSKKRSTIEVNQKTEALHIEQTDTYNDLQAVKTSFNKHTTGVMKTIRDTTEHLEIQFISFEGQTRNMISTNQYNIESKIEATRREIESQLEEVVARAERGRGTGACTHAAKQPKFDGTTSWAVFCRQFETAAEHNCWTRQEKSTYFITAMQCRATDVLHGIPRCATYEDTLQALEDRFGDQHFAATFRSQLKTRTQKQENPCRTLLQLSNNLPTAPAQHYPNSTYGERQRKRSQME